MARFVGIHTLPGVTRQTIETTVKRLGRQGDARFVRAYSSFAVGKVVCDWDAPNKEAVARAYRALSLPWDEIVAIDAIYQRGDGGHLDTRYLHGPDSRQQANTRGGTS